MVISTAQARFLALVPKISGSIGLPSSLLLLSEIIVAHRRGEGNTILRALGGVALFSALDQLGWFLSTWATPEGSWEYSKGNTQTCDFQGFLLQVVVAAPLFACTMAIYFYMIVVDTPDHVIHRTEAVLGTLIVLYAFATSFWLLAEEQYNHIGAVCWVNGYPAGCGDSTYFGSDVPCERGDYAWLYGMISLYIPIWICIVLIMTFNSLIMNKLRHADEQKWFARQSFWYAAAFFITWAPSTTWSAIQWNNPNGNYLVDVLAALFEPLWGLWNLLIFLHDRPKSRKRLRKLFCCDCSLYWADDDAEKDSNDNHAAEIKKVQESLTDNSA